MKEYSTSKEILYDIVADNSKKKETSEAYYLLAKINMEEVFDFDTIKEFLENSKDEKSSSKPGKLAKKTISKIEELQSELTLKYLQVWSNFPGVNHKECMNSIKMFTEKVIPHFKDKRKARIKQAS